MSATSTRRMRRPADAAAKPDGADTVLRRLALHYGRGERLSTDQIAAAAGCDLAVAVAVRRWARGRGIWRYRPPADHFRPADRAGREWEGGDAK